MSDEDLDFVYRVAGLAWQKGHAANTIAADLDKGGDSGWIMKIKRALRRAIEKNILQLNPPPAQDAIKGLEAKYPDTKIKFHVVDDRHRKDFQPVCLKAAQVVSARIHELLIKHPAPEEVVIAIAGGRTLSQVATFTARERTHLRADDRKRLLFVSLNAAGDSDAFHHTANYLCVKLSEQFDGKHLAVLPDNANAKKYLDAVKQAKLLICGVGTMEDGLLAKFIERHGRMPPANAVGDMCFNFLDEEGEHVTELDDVVSQLHPQPRYAGLQDAALHNKVLVILDADEPEKKAAIAHAVFARGLANMAVLGTRLARELITPVVR